MTSPTRSDSGRSAEPARIELILSQIDALPTLPAVAVRLLELTAGDAGGTADLARLIESDPAMTARILSAAGRADRGAEAETVQRAVMVLGFDAVRSLVLALEVLEVFTEGSKAGFLHFDPTGLWKHCLAVGCAAKLLVEKGFVTEGPATSGVAEQAFLGGLLHDLGKIALAASFPKTYDRVVEKADACLANIADIERETFGLDHTVAGRRLAGRWKLPAALADAIWLHHVDPGSVPSRIGHPECVRIVRLADELVRQTGIGYSGNHQPVTGLESELSSRAESVGGMEALRKELIELLEARAEWVGLETLTSSEVYEDALRQANRKLARVNTSLAQTNRALEERVACLEILEAFQTLLGEQPSFEAVCRAGAEAARRLAPQVHLVVLGDLQGGSAVILAGPKGEDATDVQVESVAGDDLVDWTAGISWREWMPVTAMPAALSDWLCSRCGRLPIRWRPIACPAEVIGALVAFAPVPEGLERTLSVLGDWMGSWMAAARSRSVAENLNEELVQINTRLAGTQAEVARMRSLAMVGQMAAGAAHELNNPLAVISGRAQMLRASAEDDAQAKTLGTIAEHAHRASEIVSELMEFAKPAPPRPTVWSLTDLWADIRRSWLEKESLSEAQFQVCLSDDVPSIRADASQIRTLFDEVIRNALDALRDAPNPLLTVNCWTDVADDKAVVRIEDNGIGMAPEVLEHCVDPFFSHRPAGRRRGLGLSRAVRYAEINGGRVRLSSRLGAGTVVLVSLPIASQV